MKPEVKKNDTIVIATATNESFMGRLHENCNLERRIFLLQEMSNLYAAGEDSSCLPSTDLPQGSRLSGMAVPTCGGNKKKLKEGNIYG